MRRHRSHRLPVRSDPRWGLYVNTYPGGQPIGFAGGVLDRDPTADYAFSGVPPRLPLEDPQVPENLSGQSTSLESTQSASVSGSASEECGCDVNIVYLLTVSGVIGGCDHCPDYNRSWRLTHVPGQDAGCDWEEFFTLASPITCDGFSITRLRAQLDLNVEQLQFSRWSGSTFRGNDALYDITVDSNCDIATTAGPGVPLNNQCDLGSWPSSITITRE